MRITINHQFCPRAKTQGSFRITGFIAGGFRLYPAGWLVRLLTLVLVATAGFADEAIKVPLQTRRVWNFDRPEIHFDCNFSGARISGCEPLGKTEFKVLLTPEHEPINDSPWYAFKVWSAQPQKITVDLVDTYSPLRFRPWLSADGQKWRVAEGREYEKATTNSPLVLHLEIGPQPVWVSCWDMVTLPQITAWTETLARRAGVEIRPAGNSIEGRPLQYFILGAVTNAELIFVIGRQHPPEITGSMGLESFVETLAGESALARAYRQRFKTVVLPVVNPDGVEHGHWRSNLGGVDLNRDWHAFSQPETRAVRDLFLQLAATSGALPLLLLDFHSTATNVFYAQPETGGDQLPGFTDQWLKAISEQLPAFGFEFDNVLGDTTVTTSKFWGHDQWRCPSITCEFSYHMDRQLIRQAGKVEAEEMMKLLLLLARTPK